MLEIAQKRSMKVGDVSTAEITDATPAVLASHISLRGCQGPTDMGPCPLETKGAGRPRSARATRPRPATENQRPASEPSLAAMTGKAIDLLDNRKGFFLQVEGASIDKQDHATNACWQIGEHTGAAVPVWGSGPGALDVLGTNDHTDLLETLGG